MVNFSGKIEIKEGDNDKAKSIKRDWNAFVSNFWAIFFIKLFSKSVAEMVIESGKANFALVAFFIQFIPLLVMVYLMGSYAYKISKRKLYILYGLFGFLWLAIIGIFLGFFAIRRVVNRELQKGNK